MKAHEALLSLSRLAKGQKKVLLSDVMARLKGPLEPIFIGLLSIPFLSFFVIPGLASIVGFIIAVNGLRIAQQKGIYLPKTVGKLKIPSWLLLKCVKWIKKFTLKRRHKRKPLDEESYRALKWLSGWLICLSGGLLAVPLPPGTNIPPAIALVLICIGLYRQAYGWVIAGGIVFAVTASAYLIAIGWSVGELHKDWPLWMDHFHLSSSLTAISTSPILFTSS